MSLQLAEQEVGEDGLQLHQDTPVAVLAIANVRGRGGGNRGALGEGQGKGSKRWGSQVGVVKERMTSVEGWGPIDGWSVVPRLLYLARLLLPVVRPRW